MRRSRLEHNTGSRLFVVSLRHTLSVGSARKRTGALKDQGDRQDAHRRFECHPTSNVKTDSAALEGTQAQTPPMFFSTLRKFRIPTTQRAHGGR